jgi:hypothetical protein
VDQRLFYIAGQRPERLTRRETPELARAMTAYFRRQASVTKGVLNDVLYVRIFNPGQFSVVVRWDDWVKIIPYLSDGSFDTTIVPEPRWCFLHPNQVFDASIVDLTDPLYNRILNTLNGIFTVEFPTSY